MHGLEWKEEQVERERGRLSPISQLLNAKIFKKPALLNINFNGNRRGEV